MERKIEYVPNRCRSCKHFVPGNKKGYCRERSLELRTKSHKTEKIRDGLYRMKIEFDVGYFVDCEFHEEKK
jgi:hypothetical protein